VIQQLREAMPFGEQPRYLLRDNDGIYGHGVRAFSPHPALRRAQDHRLWTRRLGRTTMVLT